ncbi:serine/threonine-protein kinase [Leptolyngbya sp. NK1-12]|uniref:serine/threonine-protein kinase n=1 Tax=Leptolyngbya sp. NK1-12 TaxID=2547451 RepID=UPI00292CBCA2|nr:serine/threonine-protein kinase [Leptolyngbya sp. NK1-12]
MEFRWQTMHDPDARVLLGGRYQISSYLGGGGFGQTYLAKDTHLPGDPECVVKHLKPRLVDPLSLDTAKRLFETEAQVLYRLNDYAQIPRLLAHFEEGQEFYLVQEYIDGDNLSTELMPGQRLPESRVIPLLQDILEVLVFIHQHHVIHRDLKPSNLIRRHRDQKIVLIDFGAVKQLSTQIIQVQGHTTRTIAIGSPGYMPSEQMAGRPKFCSDLYAVGMIGIQALTGAHPRELPEDPRTCELLWHDRAAVSPELTAILDKLVRYDFRERYQSALEVLIDLQPFVPERPLPLLADPHLLASIHTAADAKLQVASTTTSSGATLYSERRLDYSRLQELLLDQAWQAADRETHRLLLALSGRERGQLQLEEIRCLPCLDLHAIDYLWVNHSNGLFGFSIQKEIWLNVGGSTDGNYETWDRLSQSRSKWRVNTPWQRFSSRVGWRVKERWIDYEDYTFALDAPKGHLPSWQSNITISTLFSRMEVCRPYVPPIDITRQP